MKQIYMTIPILVCIFLNIGCIENEDQILRSQVKKSKKEVIELNSDFFEGQWIYYYTERENFLGKRNSKNYISGLHLYEFRDSFFKSTLSRAGWDKFVEEDGTFYLHEDTIIFVDKFKSNFEIVEFSKGHFEFKAPILLQKRIQYKKFKKIKLFKQKSRESEIHDFLVSNSITIKDISNEECKQNNRFEFLKVGSFNEFRDCRQNWFRGSWELSNKDYENELFLKFSNTQRPIHIKEVYKDSIIGIRYGKENSEVVIKKQYPLYQLQELLGKWKVEDSYLKTNIVQLNISSSDLELEFKDGTKTKYYFRTSNSLELFYLYDYEKPNDPFINTMKVRLSDNNKLLATFRTWDKKDKWDSLRLEKL